jgi:hypothetical protein
MEIFSALGDLNWWAVIVAALSSFVVGFVWYAKPVFGNKWMKLVGITPKEMDSSKGMIKTFSMTGLFSLLTAIILGCLMLETGTSGLINGIIFGAVIGLVFRAGAHVIHNGFAHKSGTLTVIDSAHDIAALAVMGAILGVWM